MTLLNPPAGIHGFGDRLRAWRDGNEFDLDAASRLLGVSGTCLYMIERGVHAPSAPLAARFEQLVRGLSVFHAPGIVRRIPIISWVQAGEFTRFEEMPTGWMDWLDALCPDPKAFAVQLVGDSMMPEYPPGNLAVCMPSFPPKNNGLAVAKLLDDSVTFKTVKFRGQPPASFRLEPLNPAFRPVVVARKKVTWIYPVHSVVGRCGKQSRS